MQNLSDFNNVFFIGVAGTGMSAIAQYLAGSGKKVAGSDRYFYPGVPNEIREKLETSGIKCFEQDGTGINADTDLVVVSTAVEDTVPEVQKAMGMQIPIIKRSELLALIAASRRTIAVAGTSGKSTTSGMLFQIMETAGLAPSIISGAGLVSIIREGKIGNAKVGAGEWLIIEADESDGSIVQYKPEVGLLLNIDKDHQEIEELKRIFQIFKNNTSAVFSVNRTHPLAAALSKHVEHDFSTDPAIPAGYQASGFSQKGMEIGFRVNGVPFLLQTIGKHNMENALAAATIANLLGVPLETCAKGLALYEGIYRRHQLLGIKNDVTVIDDYAHNPAKCAASIAACQHISGKVVAWFQPHGYGPTRFLKDDFIQEIARVLRPSDEIWMSEIFYAGGTAVKDISSEELINGIKALGKNAYFVADRSQFLETARPHINPGTVLLLMGARDPGLEAFSAGVWNTL